jgi:hypothetical protein
MAEMMCSLMLQQVSFSEESFATNPRTSGFRTRKQAFIMDSTHVFRELALGLENLSSWEGGVWMG